MAERAMPSFTKSPPELVERFAAVMDRYPDAVRKKMFGYPAAFVGGNMATGLFADQWVVRLPDDRDRGRRRQRGAGSFEPMPGKPMKAFVVIPAADVDDDARDRRLGRARSGPRGDHAAEEVAGLAGRIYFELAGDLGRDRLGSLVSMTIT